MAEGETKQITALNRVHATAHEVRLSIMKGEERIELAMPHKVAEDIIQTIANALTQLKSPDVDPDAGVALYEATRFEARLEQIPTALGLQEKFVLTAHAQGSTKITLRLAPEKVDAFLAQMKVDSLRRRRSSQQ